MDEPIFDPHIETYLLLKDFYTSFVISEMHRIGMVTDEDYAGYLKERSDILLTNEEDMDNGGSGERQPEEGADDEQRADEDRS